MAKKGAHMQDGKEGWGGGQNFPGPFISKKLYFDLGLFAIYVLHVANHLEIL